MKERAQLGEIRHLDVTFRMMCFACAQVEKDCHSVANLGRSILRCTVRLSSTLTNKLRSLLPRQAGNRAEEADGVCTQAGVIS